MLQYAASWTMRCETTFPSGTRAAPTPRNFIGVAISTAAIKIACSVQLACSSQLLQRVFCATRSQRSSLIAESTGAAVTLDGLLQPAQQGL